MTKRTMREIKNIPCVKFYRTNGRITAAFSRAVRIPVRAVDCKLEVLPGKRPSAFKLRFVDLNSPLRRTVKANEAPWPQELVTDPDWAPFKVPVRVYLVEGEDGWWYGDYTYRIE